VGSEELSENLDLQEYLKNIDHFMRRYDSVTMDNIHSAEGDYMREEHEMALLVVDNAHMDLKLLFPNENYYDALIRRYIIRRYKVKDEPELNKWKEIMLQFSLMSNENYNMIKALGGKPIGDQRPFFKKLLSLGLIEKDGLPSEEVKNALLEGIQEARQRRVLPHDAYLPRDGGGVGGSGVW